MLYSVCEVAEAFGVEPHRIYYLLRMSRIDGAYKVLNSWRLSDAGVKEIYDGRKFGRGDGRSPGDAGCGRFAEFLAHLKTGVIPGVTRSGSPRIQGRRRRLERSERGSRIVAGKEPAALMQLWLFEEMA